MGQALYRKYRPKSFSEVIGQEHITDTLKKSIQAGRISHAYLFTGPRGTGKTSVARILAHEVNSIGYSDESMHLDIIEIDAASNRRIDEIRDLRDKVNAAPTSSKYKVYIIDEVHMLTREAFNALLKTLEEPPKHCIFILATTEVSKLPETIISRTQRFEFKPVTTATSTARLAQIAKSEKLDVDEEALALLSQHGSGSMRDSISLLDQLSSYGNKISTDTVEQYLGLPPKKIILSLFSAIEQGAADKVISLLDELNEHGSSAVLISNSLSKVCRDAYLADFSKSWLTNFIQKLLLTPSKPDPESFLEILLIETAVNNRLPAGKQAETTTPPAAKQTSQDNSDPTQMEEPTPTVKIPRSKAELLELNSDSWEQIIEMSKEKTASIYTALRLAKPEFFADKVVLTFKFPLHKNKIDQAKHKDIISGLIQEVTGKKLAVETIVDKEVKKEAPKAAKPADIKSISNIFPDAEMLES